MRGHSSRRGFAALLRKEWRELRASGAWWVLVLLTGPLVGISFIRAVETYAEISQGAGAACGRVCAPMLGIWSPTFAAFDVLTIFLLPLVVIRLVTADRSSGAARLEWQREFPSTLRVAAKLLVLTAGAVLPAIAGLVAVVLWKTYGGHVHGAEVLTVAAGHALHALLTASVAAVAGAATDHPSTAAVLALGFTVGTWVVEFAGAIYGGLWASAASFSPARLAQPLQRGLVESKSLIPAIGWAGGLLVLCGLALIPGLSRRRRSVRAALLVAATCAFAWAGSWAPGVLDVTEARFNSFPRGAERALGAISEPVAIEARLAAEDPRRVDLERNAFAKLRRAVPDIAITYTSRTATGLFEQQDASYGEIHYRVGSRTVIGRVTTEDAVLDDLFEAAGAEPDGDDEPEFRGHPLDTRPHGAALAFYGIWPAMAALLAWFASKQRAPSRQ